jgi:hypothetical protein
MALDQRDGGYRSRKWWAFIVTSAAVVLAGLIAPSGVVGEVVLGLVTALGIFSGANVGRDWVALRRPARGSDRGRPQSSSREETNTAPPSS